MGAPGSTRSDLTTFYYGYLETAQAQIMRGGAAGETCANDDGMWFIGHKLIQSN